MRQALDCILTTAQQSTNKHVMPIDAPPELIERIIHKVLLIERENGNTVNPHLPSLVPFQLIERQDRNRHATIMCPTDQRLHTMFPVILTVEAILIPIAGTRQNNRLIGDISRDPGEKDAISRNGPVMYAGVKFALLLVERRPHISGPILAIASLSYPHALQSFQLAYIAAAHILTDAIARRRNTLRGLAQSRERGKTSLLFMHWHLRIEDRSHRAIAHTIHENVLLMLRLHRVNLRLVLKLLNLLVRLHLVLCHLCLDRYFLHHDRACIDKLNF